MCVTVAEKDEESIAAGNEHPSLIILRLFASVIRLSFIEIARLIALFLTHVDLPAHRILCHSQLSLWLVGMISTPCCLYCSSLALITAHLCQTGGRRVEGWVDLGGCLYTCMFYHPACDHPSKY